MVEKLLEMSVNETKEFDREEFETLQTTKSRLKKSGKGEWISNLSFNGLFVKRIK
jgi:hypothetical protein